MSSMIVGRDAQQVDVAITSDNSISRRHVRISPSSGGQFVLEDLGSSAGTFVRTDQGWQRVTSQVVDERSRIRLGTYETTIGRLMAEPGARGGLNSHAPPAVRSTRHRDRTHSSSSRHRGATAQDYDDAAYATEGDKVWAILAVVLGFFTSFIGPLILWLITKDDSPFMRAFGRELLNFHLTMILYGLVCFALAFVVIGFFLLPVLGLFALIVQIVALVKGIQGEVYRFPAIIRLV